MDLRYQAQDFALCETGAPGNPTINKQAKRAETHGIRFHPCR
jgi:hypothetical protein